MHGHAADVVVDELDLAGVHANPDVELECLDAIADRGRAAQRSDCALEGGNEPVTGCVDLVSAEALEERTDESVVLGEELPPAHIAEPARRRGRVDDVR